MSGIIKRMTLTGNLKGSAFLSEENGRTEIAFSLGRMPKGASVFTVGNGGIIKSEAGSTVSVNDTGVCGVAVADGSRLISYGFTGDCYKNRQKLLSEIRIRAGESKPSAGKPAAKEKTPPPVKKTQKREAKTPSRAAVTEDILKRAEQLFSVLKSIEDGAVKKEAPVSTETKEVYMEIKNPFPRTYPNSVWRVKDGDGRLFGRLPSGRELIAVPLDLKSGRIKNTVRTIVSSDGRRYFIGEL